MPTYEISLMLRTMSRPEIISTLKRTATQIFDKGGFVRKVENLGPRNLPYKISEHGVVNKTGSLFIMKFDVAPKHVQELEEEYARDVDIIRKLVVKMEDQKKLECTLEEELQPPAYRKDVIKLMEIAKKKQKAKYPHNSGLNYYPFQK